MRRAMVSTPRLDKLRALLLPCLDRRGAASELARMWSAGGKDKRQQISVWFKRGEGRPMAVPTLLALQFLMAQPEWQVEEFYVPTWDEMVRIVIPLLSARGMAADLTRFCARKPHDISRYFSRQPNRRREPEGEVALATLDWLTRWRVERSLAENGDRPMPSSAVWDALERAFELEAKFRSKREQDEGRPFFFPGGALFDEMIPGSGHEGGP